MEEDFPPPEVELAFTFTEALPLLELDDDFPPPVEVTPFFLIEDEDADFPPPYTTRLSAHQIRIKGKQLYDLYYHTTAFLPCCLYCMYN